MKERNLARNRRGLQWAYDTFEGAFDVAKKSSETAFELIGDALDSYSSLSWSHIVIFILVITNIWTIWGATGRRSERKKEMLRSEERERWVKEAVTTLWQELAKNGGMSPHPVYAPAASGTLTSGRNRRKVRVLERRRGRYFEGVGRAANEARWPESSLERGPDASSVSGSTSGIAERSRLDESS
jgi:hypothetical protein